MKNTIASMALALGLVACGGGGTDVAPVTPPVQRLVGEVIASPSEIPTAELATQAGYSGRVPTSNALHDAGKQNLLDLLFMLNGAGTQGRNHDKVADDAEQKLIQYARDNARILTPGVRVLVLDEMYWNPPDATDTAAVLQPQLDALRAAVALVRKHIPQAKVGITFTPYAVMGRPQTLEYVRRAITLVDWVGTDPYWFGDPGNVQALHDWSGSFHSLAKQANPRVETWFIAQAFKLAPWDVAVFNAFIARQLVYAQQYDHVLFFGWQYASELDPASAGQFFPDSTKRLYNQYLKVPLP